jgi:hypothetical protein
MHALGRIGLERIGKDWGRPICIICDASHNSNNADTFGVHITFLTDVRGTLESCNFEASSGDRRAASQVSLSQTNRNSKLFDPVGLERHNYMLTHALHFKIQPTARYAVYCMSYVPEQTEDADKARNQFVPWGKVNFRQRLRIRHADVVASGKNIGVILRRINAIDC